MLARGERERLIRVRNAPGKNRDCALFELRTEPAPPDFASRMRELNLVAASPNQTQTTESFA
jgi:hypothetical protein